MPVLDNAARADGGREGESNGRRPRLKRDNPSCQCWATQRGTRGSQEERIDDRDTATRFRAMVARCNFWCGDRPDSQVAANEAPRSMVAPPVGDLDKVLCVLPSTLMSVYHRIMQRFPSDWAGWLVIGKSTSGGVLLIGQRMCRHLSATQKVIALSVPEAELYAATKANREAKGLGRDFGEDLRIAPWVDAQAKIGLRFRQGLGKAAISRPLSS